MKPSGRSRALGGTQPPRFPALGCACGTRDSYDDAQPPACPHAPRTNATRERRTLRLFIAFELPDPWREALTAAQRSLSEAVEPRVLRFVDAELMHLTLRFIGEVDDETGERLHDQLRAALTDVEVELALGEPGTFGGPGRTSVAWVGVEGDRPGLDAVVAAIDVAVTDAGLAADERPVRPHLTLARVTRTATTAQRRAVAAAISALAAPAPLPAHFREVSLVRSYLGGAAPRYDVLARYGPHTHS